jgi:hypothetical protein
MPGGSPDTASPDTPRSHKPVLADPPPKRYSLSPGTILSYRADQLWDRGRGVISTPDTPLTTHLNRGCSGPLGVLPSDQHAFGLSRTHASCRVPGAYASPWG